ncbi:hypothetical protein SAMN02910358_01226 [Lachnospiraceae bacterium XBB1006]|nr:hypothetical protein SAMN02910358_01226 [Lachnospiraceae bacterium XBB1006]
MKALYRSFGQTYHEGDKAEEMIRRLDFQRIAEKGSIDLKSLKDMLVAKVEN